MRSWAPGSGSFVSLAKGGNGQAGPFGSCQGVLLSQDRSVLPQTLRRARFPPSAADFLICPSALGREGAGRGTLGAWEKGTQLPRGSGRRKDLQSDLIQPWISIA